MEPPPLIHAQRSTWEKIYTGAVIAFIAGFGLLIFTCTYASPADEEKAIESVTAVVVKGAMACVAFAWTLSSFSKRKRFRQFVFFATGAIGLFALSIPLLVSVIESKRANVRDRDWAAKAQAGVNKFLKQAQNGSVGDGMPIEKTGDKINDEISGAANKMIAEFGSFMVGMNGELDALKPRGIFDTSILTDSKILDDETSKRVQSLRIVARYHAKVPNLKVSMDSAFAAMDVSDTDRQGAVKSVDELWVTVGPRFDRMFKILEAKQQTELDYLRFFAAWAGTYSMVGEKISFKTDEESNQYNALVKAIGDADDALAQFRKEQEQRNSEGQNALSKIGK